MAILVNILYIENSFATPILKESFLPLVVISIAFGIIKLREERKFIHQTLIANLGTVPLNLFLSSLNLVTSYFSLKDRFFSNLTFTSTYLCSSRLKIEL
jgi:hypothetical protein